MSQNCFRALKIILVVFFVFVFTFKTFTFIDPDLGWHLRAGEIVEQTGHAPQTDPWTYTMQGHKWVDHEWLVDLVMWKFWQNGTWFYVELFFVIVGLIPLLIWIRRAKFPVELIWISLGALMLLDITGVRPQILSFFLFFIVWELLAKRYIEKKSQKIFYALPLLFLFWANIHAGFVAGLGILVVSLLIDLFQHQTKKGHIFPILRRDGVVVILSFLATLITPYGINLWVEVVESTMTPLIRAISEWQSSFVSWNIAYPIFIGLLIGLIFALHKKLNKTEMFISLIFIFASISHARMLPMLLVIAIPLLGKCANEFYKLLYVTPEKEKINRIIAFTAIIVVTCTLFFIAKSGNIVYPYHPAMNAVRIETILHKQVGGNTFNDYGLGGAIILSDPSTHVFIDGRLPHWRNGDGYSALQNYLDVISISGEWKHTFAKYDIRMVILSHEHEDQINAHKIIAQINRYSPIMQMILRVLLPDKTPILLPELLENGWCRVYRDEEATILASPDTSLCHQKTTP